MRIGVTPGVAGVFGGANGRPASAVEHGSRPAPAGTPDASNLRVAQFNLWNFFDTDDDPATEDKVLSPQDYKTKLAKVALAIASELGTPDIISLNEIENERVLDDLLQQPAMQAAGYKRIVGDLNDRRGIRVGMLYRDAKLEPVKVSQINPHISLPDPANGQVDPTLLFARAPLIVDFALRGAAQASEGVAQLTVIANHFKSKLGGNGPEARRQAQGQTVGELVDARRAANPNVPIMVLGDLNATYDDGAFKKLAQRADGSARLQDVPLSIPSDDRYTYIYRGRKDMLDHMMVTPEWASSLVKARIPHFNTASGAMGDVSNPKVAAGVSDHDPMVADFDLSKLISKGQPVAVARSGASLIQH